MFIGGGGFGGAGGGGGDGGAPSWLIYLFGSLITIFFACSIYARCHCCREWLESKIPCLKGPFCGCCGKQPTTPCYLCGDRIKDDPWNDGSHRKECASRNEAVLGAMPTPYAVNCPKCGKKLRVWPKRGSFFTCDDKDCPQEENAKLINIGTNRLNCFICDYDLCLSCAKRKDAAAAKNAPTLSLNVSQLPTEIAPPPSYEESQHTVVSEYV